jgi:hypothetical protein
MRHVARPAPARARGVKPAVAGDLMVPLSRGFAFEDTADAGHAGDRTQAPGVVVLDA